MYKNHRNNGRSRGTAVLIETCAKSNECVKEDMSKNLIGPYVAHNSRITARGFNKINKTEKKYLVARRYQLHRLGIFISAYNKLVNAGLVPGRMLHPAMTKDVNRLKILAKRRKALDDINVLPGPGKALAFMAIDTLSRFNGSDVAWHRIRIRKMWGLVNALDATLGEDREYEEPPKKLTEDELLDKRLESIFP